jgi:hypothetical protein
VRDAGTNATIFVSRATGATGAPATGAASQDPAISGNGRLVAFESDADNSSPEDSNIVTNIYVRGLVANTTGWSAARRVQGAPGRTATRTSRTSRTTGGW